MGVTASAMLAAANRNPDAVFNYNFLDFLTLYVVSFVLLDVFAPAVAPALTAHASIRRGVKLSVRFLVLGVASLCKRPKQLEILSRGASARIPRRASHAFPRAQTLRVAPDGAPRATFEGPRAAQGGGGRAPGGEGEQPVRGRGSVAG